MGLPKDIVKPAINYTHPSERPYFDPSKSTPDALVAIDNTKSGTDYGVTDAPVVEPVAGTTSETGNGAKGV